MKSKMLVIIVITLFLLLTPSAIGEIVDSELYVKKPCLDIGRFFLKGLVLFPHYSDDDLICFAIRLFYIEINPIERTWGCFTLQWVTLENFTGRIKTGPFNIIGWLIVNNLGSLWTTIT